MSTVSGRWAAASGYVVVGFGIAGAAFERGGPPLNAPVDQTIAFFSTYRSELLSQSLMFVLSAGAYLWFFGVLRTFLLQAEGGPGMLSTIAFGAGIVNAGIQMVFQGLQVAVAMVCLRDHAFPAWLGTLSASAAVAHALMSLGLVVENGPLVPGGMLTYGLYAITLLWLVATTTVMVVRSGQPHRFEAINPGGLHPL
jgi:hypothetical protein